MRVRQVSYSRGVTLNMDDYQSLRIDLGVKIDLDKEETFAQGYALAKAMVKDALYAEMQRVTHPKKDK